MKTKPCSKCGIIKTLDQFYKDRRNGRKEIASCRVCEIKRKTIWYQKNKLKVKIKEALKKESQ